MKKKIMFFSLSLVMCVLFVFHEYILNVHSDYRLWRGILKFSMSLIPVIIAFTGWKSSHENFVKHIVIALSFFCIGDVAINLLQIAGMAMFFCGNIYFACAYFRYKRPSKICFICWILSFVIIDTLIFITRFPLSLKIPASVYITSMTAMVASSFSTPHVLNIGSVIFGLSDILIIRNTAFGVTVLSHIISLGVYYIGVMIIAWFALNYAANKDNKINKKE